MSWPIKNEIELKAEKILRFCQRKTHSDYPSTKIPIEEYIEGPLGIRLEVEDLSYLGKHVIGAAYVKERIIKASPSLEHYEGRFRFTLAHELGHILLDDSYNFPICDTRADILSYIVRQEATVNDFASYLLMPWIVIDRVLMDCCRRWDMYPKSHIPMLWSDTRRSRWLWKKRFLPHLTRLMGVSLSAAICRFNRLKLPNGKPFLPGTMKRYLLCSETSLQNHLGNIKLRVSNMKTGSPTRPLRQARFVQWV